MERSESAEKMTTEYLTKEIQAARRTLEEIRPNLNPSAKCRYILLCEHVTRLYRFRNYISSKAYSKGAGDWMTPEQAQEKSRLESAIPSNRATESGFI